MKPCRFTGLSIAFFHLLHVTVIARGQAVRGIDIANQDSRVAEQQDSDLHFFVAEVLASVLASKLGNGLFVQTASNKLGLDSFAVLSESESLCLGKVVGHKNWVVVGWAANGLGHIVLGLARSQGLVINVKKTS